MLSPNFIPRSRALGRKGGKNGEKGGLNLKEYTRQEVAEHNKDSDCWVIVHGKVYDVTHYLVQHPGGKSLLFRDAGGDATEDFEGLFHSKKAREILAKMMIGTLTTKKRSLRRSTAKPTQSSSSSSSSSAPNVPTFSAPTSTKTESRPTRQRLTLRLVSISDINHNCKRMKFSVDGTETLDLKPGQHLYLSVHKCKRMKFSVDGTETLDLKPGQHLYPSIPKTKEDSITRPYTPINYSSKDLEFIIKSYPAPEGVMSRYLHSLDSGASIEAFPEAATRVWDGAKALKGVTHVLALAAGTGITAIFPVLQTLATSSSSPSSSTIRCHTALSFKNSKDLLMFDELEGLAANSKSHASDEQKDCAPSTSFSISISTLFSEWLRTLIHTTVAQSYLEIFKSKGTMHAVLGPLEKDGPSSRRLDVSSLSDCFERLLTNPDGSRSSIDPSSVFTLICGTRGYNAAALALLNETQFSKKVHVFE